jgi:calcium uniporter protein, mitochondrial
MHGAEFQHHLDLLRQFKGVVPYSQFLQEFRRSVPAASEEDVVRVTDALATSGSILRHGNLVYLRPTEILSTLRRILPQDVTAVRTRLAETEQSLQVLEEERTKIVNRAGLRSRLLNYTFFTAVLTQWLVLFRLTYWELSWDVIVGFI